MVLLLLLRGKPSLDLFILTKIVGRYNLRIYANRYADCHHSGKFGLLGTQRYNPRSIVNRQVHIQKEKSCKNLGGNVG
jgi:hypothetical protein